MTISVNDTIQILDKNGPIQTINYHTAHWYQIQYRESTGWVWGGFIQLLK